MAKSKNNHSNSTLSKAAKDLSSPKTSKTEKSKAGQILKNHQDKYH